MKKVPPIETPCSAYNELLLPSLPLARMTPEAVNVVVEMPEEVRVPVVVVPVTARFCVMVPDVKEALLPVTEPVTAKLQHRQKQHYC